MTTNILKMLHHLDRYRAVNSPCRNTRPATLSQRALTVGTWKEDKSIVEKKMMLSVAVSLTWMSALATFSVAPPYLKSTYLRYMMVSLWAPSNRPLRLKILLKWV
jgi:hypothetical protein